MLVPPAEEEVDARGERKRGPWVCQREYAREVERQLRQEAASAMRHTHLPNRFDTPSHIQVRLSATPSQAARLEVAHG